MPSKFFYSLFIYILLTDSVLADINSEEEFFNLLSSYHFFSSSFTQTTLSKEQERNIQGEIIVDRTGRFKLSYFEPLNEIIFSDGISLYRYDPELEQADVQPLEDLLKETPIGLFALRTKELKHTFSLDWCENRSTFLRCKLSSLKENSFVKEVIVEIRNKIINKLSYKDNFDQEISLNFQNPSTKKVPQSKFKVIIPEGTDIVSSKNTLK